MLVSAARVAQLHPLCKNARDPVFIALFLVPNMPVMRERERTSGHIDTGDPVSASAERNSDAALGERAQGEGQDAEHRVRLHLQGE